jgi:hypothetical protein
MTNRGSTAGVRNLVRERWRLLLAIVGLAAVAVIWAIFPAIQGGAPDRLISGPLVVSAVSCSDCPFFDISSADVSVDGGTYSEDDLEARERSGDPLMWAFSQRGVPVILDFTVGNDTEDDQILIRSLELDVRDHQEAPDSMRLGCFPPEQPGVTGGSPAEAVRFTMSLGPGAQGRTRVTPDSDGTSVGRELSPSQLQAYRGELNVAEPGIYGLDISMEYETSSGESRSAESPLVELALLGPSTDITAVPPAGESVCQTSAFPGTGRPSLLQDVKVETSNGATAVVFEFADDSPTYSVGYVEPPIIEQPSGRELEVAGEAFVEITLSPASSFEDAGGEPVPTYEGPDRIETDMGGITEVVSTGEQEGIMSWVIGLDERRPFGFSTASQPPRVMVEIGRAPGG